VRARRRFSTVASLTSAVALFASSCASTAHIRTIPTGADVYVDGQYLGKSPVEYTSSATVAGTQSVRIEAPGYEPQFGHIKRDGDVNVGAAIGGFFCLFPFLWVLDYRGEYVFQLKSQMAAPLPPPPPPPPPATTP